MSIVKRVTEKESYLIDSLRENNIINFIDFFDKTLLKNEDISREFQENTNIKEIYKVLSSSIPTNCILNKETKEYIISKIKSNNNIVVKGSIATGKSTILNEIKEYCHKSGYKTIHLGEIKTNANYGVEDIRTIMQNPNTKVVLIVDETLSNIIYMFSLLYAIDNGIPTIFSIPSSNEKSNWKEIFTKNYYVGRNLFPPIASLHQSNFIEIYSYIDKSTKERCFELIEKEV